MTRRNKTSPADDFMSWVAMLPWWAGIALALVFYVVLHRIAAQAVVAAVSPTQLSAMVTQTIGKSLATIGQYVLPLLCLAGSGVSAWRRHQRRTLLTDVVQSKASDALDGMSWREFELLVGEAFRLQSYRVVDAGGGGADGGIDLVLTKGAEKFLVQCKQWKALKVGVDVVRELYGVMAAKGATGGFVVTSGRFTDDATKFAQGRNVKLVDGPALLGLIRQAQASLGKSPVAATRPQPVTAVESADRRASPPCPSCSSAMVQRKAKRGPNAGAQFWGCVSYPACRGTRPIG